jgi:hypothetical protein
MGEVSMNVGNAGVITVRLEPNSVTGRDIAGQPALYLPLQFQLLPLRSQTAEFPYALIRVSGKLQNPVLNEFATFDLGPLALGPNPTPYFRHQEAIVLLDRHRVRRLEDARAGNDASLQLVFSGLLWHQTRQEFQITSPTGNLDVQVPKSHWIEKVVSVWNLSNVKLVEIKFTDGTAGENFRAAYTRVEEAEKLFAGGHYKQALTSLRLSFEGLAKSFGFDKPGEEFFGSLFASSHPEKAEKARKALAGLYRFLHLGPHEQAAQGGANDLTVTRHDARFALTMAYAILEYITPNA